MIKLFKNGKELCAVEEYNFSQGEQKVNFLKPIGGIPRTRIRMPEQKDVDRVTFFVPMFLVRDNPSKCELRDDKGNSRSIIIEDIEPKQNQSFVKAIIY